MGELFDADTHSFPGDETNRDGYGPIVVAGFESECAGLSEECDGTIYEGDQIRGKHGEWFHVGCEL